MTKLSTNFIKITGIVFIILLIILLSCVYVTREGFQDQEPTPTSTSVDECGFQESEEGENNDSDSDCSKVVTRDGDEFQVRNVCPKDPRCLGICIDNFTWTEKNINDLGAFSQGLGASVGELKSDEFNHLVISSRCAECVKNFYRGANLLENTNTCD
jgi:hypothetical protein